MTGSSLRSTRPAVYRIRVDGHLDHSWAPSLGELTLIHDEDGTTNLIATISDQAELHGLLARIRDLSLTLISVDRTTR